MTPTVACPRDGGPVYMVQAEKTDRCIRCSNWSPQIVKCQKCGAQWCPKCWQSGAAHGAVPPTPLKGIADEGFGV